MIYLDHNATTIPLAEVREMVCGLMQSPYNPSSIHSVGRNARMIIEKARNSVANLLNINLRNREFEVIFTSSGTEANNLIISSFKNADIFISATEHLSILILKEYYTNIKIIKVDDDGIIDLQDLEQKLAGSHNAKKLISVMLANNETGVIQSLEKITQVAKKYNAFVHSDIVQAVGKIKVDIPALNVDFATLSSHKFGGILGAAALIMKTSYTLIPLIVGGGQEKGLRSGSENIPAIAGMGLAAEIAQDQLKERHNKMKNLQDKLETSLLNTKIIAKNVLRLPNTSLIVANEGSDAITQLIAFDLRNIAVSSGAACSSGKVGNSHVLKAMGASAYEIKSAIRVSFSHTNDFEDVDSFVGAFNEINRNNIVKT